MVPRQGVRFADNWSMATVLAAIGASALVVIVIQFSILLRRLDRLVVAFPELLKPKEGQTINVNLGQLPVVHEAQAGKIDAEEPPAAKIEAVTPVAPAEETPENPPPEEPEPPPPPPPPPPRPAPGIRATTSGLTAVKCPACGSENSSYRTECFNCGKSL